MINQTFPFNIYQFNRIIKKLIATPSVFYLAFIDLWLSATGKKNRIPALDGWRYPPLNM
jgi:hypothetical protein